LDCIEVDDALISVIRAPDMVEIGAIYGMKGSVETTKLVVELVYC
jgi:hypothetical protein